MKSILYWLKKVMYVLYYGSNSKEHTNFVIANGKCNEEFIDKYINVMNLKFLTDYIELDYKLIDKYKNKLDWYKLSVRQDIDEDFIDKYSRHLNWWFILYKRKLSEEFITKHLGKSINTITHWYNLWNYQTLSEEFIVKNITNVDWVTISRTQRLSEEFISKYKDLVNWEHITSFQTLSEEFILNHRKYIKWSDVRKYQVVSEKFAKTRRWKKRLIGVAHNCGYSRRTIFRYSDNPKIIHIGCSSYTEAEAIIAIKERYKHNPTLRDDYLQKVNLCYNM